MGKLKIFISGTQDDMKPERDAVDRAVNSTTLSTGIRAETTAGRARLAVGGSSCSGSDARPGTRRRSQLL